MHCGRRAPHAEVAATLRTPMVEGERSKEARACSESDGDIQEGPASELDGWRQLIDLVDDQLLVLLNRRAKYAAEIGRLKRNAGVAAYSPGREQEILEGAVRRNVGPLPNDAVRQIFTSIICECRLLQDAGSGVDGTHAFTLGERRLSRTCAGT